MFAFRRPVAPFALTLCLFVSLVATAAPPPSPLRKGRDVQALDGVWKFQTDPEKRGEAEGWKRAAPPSARESVVPGLWNTGAAPGYSGVAWYWRDFETPAGWKGQTVRLRFEAAAEKAQVWLNGESLGAHTGGATPFEFNVTQAIRIGGKNTLAVRLEGDAKAGAGLWQGVLLLAHDEAYIADCFAQGNGLGNLNAAITFLNTSRNSGDATLDGRIVAATESRRDLLKTHQTLHLTPGRNLTTLLLTLRGRNLHLWSPETPLLYRLQLIFRQGEDILDTQETVFGFREFGFKEGAITLNGEPLTLTAVAPRPPQPVVIATTTDMERARESLRRLKDKGVNVLHLDAPPSALLAMADEVGLLVVEGPRPDQTAKAAADELRALLLRDRSHPCLLAWNLGDADSATAQLARQLDPTRFLLVGPANARKLWLPGQNEASAVPPPSGLLPLP
ncbi:MAG TPA: beta galactosidase jelly roll domain-containing protein [Chthonomonadaceae bacterium]|nr:beta galactosidase jelly roll domain-containing protein [Chthonomonadaceae bacterium]